MVRDVQDVQDVSLGPKLVNEVCMDLFLQEIVATSIRVSHRLEEGVQKQGDNDGISDAQVGKSMSSINNDFPGSVNVFNSPLIHKDDVTIRIENYGYNLGLRLAELLCFTSTNISGGPIVDILDIMKLVCRDVWKSLYGKQMDNLRTNHRGTFVLVDNSYRLISRMCSGKGQSDTLTKANVHLWFPCGVIRGIMSNFGVEGTVSANITQFPSVTFNIQTSVNN